jgi:hypothetical protein
MNKLLFSFCLTWLTQVAAFAQNSNMDPIKEIDRGLSAQPSRSDNRPEALPKKEISGTIRRTEEDATENQALPQLYYNRTENSNPNVANDSGRIYLGDQIKSMDKPNHQGTTIPGGFSRNAVDTLENLPNVRADSVLEK